MKEPFRNLDETRQKEIFNAALHEFATYGYEDASTNRIVKNAGMSKGMLYYYFKNKESVFEACLEYALELVEKEYLGRRFPYQGFIERTRLITRLKREFNIANPEVSSFVTNVYVHNDMPEDYQPMIDQLIEIAYKQIYDNIDLSPFRDDVDHEIQMELIRMTVQGYAQQVELDIRKNNVDWRHTDKYWDEFDNYLEALKTIYYKEEYQ